VVRFLPFLISLALSVYALFSCIQTSDEDVPHLPKLVWIVLIVFVPFVGPIVWLLMLRTQLGRRDRAVRPPKPGSRPVAPDDDPDFLKTLDRYRDPRTTVKPPHDETPPQDERPPQDKRPPEPEPDAEPGKPERKPKSQPKPKAEDETPSESDDGKA
jgi:outer membrane biosynthesis protein TonB